MKGNNLVNELFENPDSFIEDGKGYDLLQEYFNGLTLDTLIPLLNSGNDLIQGEAVWIASELGEKGCNFLLDSIIPLTNHNDTSIKYFALECVFLGTFNDRFDDFIYLINAIGSEIEYISYSSMHLISNASNNQLEACKNIDLYIEHGVDNCEQHLEGIQSLLDSDRIKREDVFKMINSDHNHITQKYGAIICKKKYTEQPEWINFVLMNPNVEKFGKEVIELLSED